MHNDAYRFILFAILIFVFVNNLISLFMGLEDTTAMIDVCLLLVFYGVGATLTHNIDDGGE